MGSAVATPIENSSDSKLRRTAFDLSAAASLESWIDAMDEQLPALTNFILPSGGLAVASCTTYAYTDLHAHKVSQVAFLR